MIEVDTKRTCIILIIFKINCWHDNKIYAIIIIAYHGIILSFNQANDDLYESVITYTVHYTCNYMKYDIKINIQN